MKRIRGIFLLISIHAFVLVQGQSLTLEQDDLHFQWDMARDAATLVKHSTGAAIWKGSLLPAWWIMQKGQHKLVKASFIHLDSVGRGKWKAQLGIEQIGTAELVVQKEKAGLRFRQLKVQWNGKPPAIISMYFGVTLPARPGGVTPSWDKPFVPDWQATGFCVPGAKEGPEQSFFRSWDFGNANIALGSFGPSMGSPYAAAFPRPLLFAGMGSNDGFVALGAGSIPDAAMSLRIVGARGCFEYLYDEEIWGAAAGSTREWNEPLRLSIAENAWQAFAAYYSFFPQTTRTGVNKIRASWNSWGTWAAQQYVIPAVSAMAHQLGAGLFVIDGSWESSVGSALPNLKRFPQFFDEIKALATDSMQTGVWQSVGWIADPYSAGLTNDDLLKNKYGKPCRANWNFDPFGESYYCLDPSSGAARKFLVQRTARLMKMLQPKLLKLDFGYGLPSPAMAVPRNAAYRGEKYAYELIKIISEAAKDIDPDCVIMYYGISPLWSALEDVVSMDDQGDLWYDMKKGHDSWSVWASLLGGTHTALSGSSGYHWEQDDEAVLNSCILGVPGAVLPVIYKDSIAGHQQYLNRRLAINSWFRKTFLWQPLWLNSSPGNFNGPPVLNCWGRLEQKDSALVLTALVLREENKEKIRDERVSGLTWSGRWALLSQDDKDIFSSSKLAVIPFDSGAVSIPLPKKPSRVMIKNINGDHLYKEWSWTGGKIIIHVNKETLENTAGFLIE